MNKAGVFHQCGDQWCFALDRNTLQIRLQTAAGDIDRVEIVCGDPFEWDTSVTPHVWASAAHPMNRAATDGVHDYWEFRFEPPFRRLKYWFILYKGKRSWEFGEKGIVDEVDRNNTWNTFVFPYIQPTEVFRAPEWIADTVWYQIFPDRFCNPAPDGGSFATRPWQYGPVTNRELYGGNLAGITAKLDHIAGLGFNGIYLTPIFKSPSNHKYNTTDYLQIDPAFGTEDDLRELVRECHRRGIRILLDAVFNHSGTEFAPWKDVLEHGEKSRYRDWFVIDRFPLFSHAQLAARERKDWRRADDSHESGYLTFAFTNSMPKLNTANPETREYLLGVAEHYIRTCDIDGWRLDVSNEVDHEFWRQFRARVKAAKADAYIVGEIWHHSIDWLRGDQYDAIMNYHFGQAISNFLSGNPEVPDGRALANRLTILEKSYPDPVLRAGFNLLDSHDTDRLITRLGDNVSAARQAWLLFALLPASPCFYYGSEYGLRGGNDPECRRCMPWDEAHQEPGQHDFIREIIALRRSHAGLVNGGTREWLWDARQGGVFGMRISGKPEGRGADRERGGTITVILNRTGKPLPASKYRKLLTAAELDSGAFGDIPADGWAYAAL